MPSEANVCPECGESSLFQSSGFSDESSGDHPLGYARQETYLCLSCHARFIRRFTPEFYNVKKASIIPKWMMKKFGKYLKTLPADAGCVT